MKGLFSYCNLHGIKSVKLDCWNENEDLTNYYKKQGFIEAGKATCEYEIGGTYCLLCKNL